MDRFAFIEQLKSSGLIADRRVRVRVQDPDLQRLDGRGLARLLLRQSILTPYQANQLLVCKGGELLLGHYSLIERLGQGGMGQVYKAVHRKLGKTVAIKVLSSHLGQDQRAMARFQREIEASSRVTHPNIVTALDAAEANGVKFLVMEYVEGIDLKRLVKQTGPLPVDLACHCIRQAALGLQHAHECGLVHRDLKPSNLLWQAKWEVSTDAQGQHRLLYGNLKILDLGLARIMADEDEPEANRAGLTQIHEIMGTPDFMAPEQARNSRRADHRSDIYGLGATLYYCLAGQPPFPEGTTMEKLMQHQSDEPPPIETVRAEVPPSLGNLLRGMMAKDPTKRIQQASEVAHALERWRDPPTVVIEHGLDTPDSVETVTDQTDASRSTFQFIPGAAEGFRRVTPPSKAANAIWFVLGIGAACILILLVVLFGLFVSG